MVGSAVNVMNSMRAMDAELSRSTDLAVLGESASPARSAARVTAGPRLGLPNAEELRNLQAYGEILVKSGLFPKHITTWQAAVVTMRYGYQLGVDEFTAANNIYLVNNKPACFASLMHGLILRDHGDNAIQIEETSPERVVLRCRRRGSEQATLISYTMEEAKVAQLATKDTWKLYPTDMLFSRAISRAGRMIFRDSTLGMYTPEEIGGEIIEVEGRVVEAPPREVVDVETGEITQPLDPRAKANAKAHFEADARGYDHEALHRIMRFHWPVMKSMKDLTEAMLTDLSSQIKDASDEELAQWSRDWKAEIDALPVTPASLPILQQIGTAMNAAGVNRETRPDLARHYADAQKAMRQAE